MINRLIITEQERRRILFLHEQEKRKDGTYTKEEFPVQNLGNTFEYGKYESQAAKNAINSMKPKIEEFINKSDSSSFEVTITGGESQVTNPKGFETPGSLASARMAQVKKYFEEIFPELIKSGKLKIKVGQPQIGTTPYEKGDQNKPEKKRLYQAEQFIRYSITGVGEKRKPLDFCSGGKQEARGNYLPSKQSFTETSEWDVGDGEGQFYLYSEAHSMPDILYFEYDGKVYFDKTKKGTVGFQGEDAPYTRLLIGTALIAKFGEGATLPAQFGDTTYQKIDINKYSNAIDDVKRNGWSIAESFINIFGAGEEFDNPKYMEALKNYDAQGGAKKLIKNLGPNFPWGYLTSPIRPMLAKNIPVIKKDRVNTIKIINVAPNGGTKWNVGTTCKEF